ncbi:MAG: fatty acyl-AMP ligase [Acidobacteriota bacterium]|nr:fatty acyl-AMP ligase [Acidobacteriota bacterium]
MSTRLSTELPTVPEALTDAAESACGITFVSMQESEETVSYRELSSSTSEIAAGLGRRGVKKGDRVALILPDEKEFVASFCGIVASGAVAVPLAPPTSVRRLGSFLASCTPLIRKARARLVVTAPALRSALGSLRTACPDLRDIVSSQELSGPGQHVDPGLGPDDPAMIQFTSGSTSEPKGVVLSHGNIAANCIAIMQEGLRAEPGDRPLSWLPLFHDMGLIGFVLTPLFAKLPTTLMPPLLFLRRPSSWLRYLAKHRGTITYAPNFAYGYATKRIKDEQIEGIDLSSVRVLGCGAEPIHAETLRGFARRFAAYGIREEAFYPSYGMAESSLAISFGRGIPVERVCRRELALDNHAVAADGNDKDGALELVGCGRAFSGHGLKIVDPVSGKPLPQRRVGEIRIEGPSVTSGYFEAPEHTAALFDEEGWLRTGDLGYVSNGQLFPCGRSKEMIIIRGRNYYPQDIEWAAGCVDGVRTGCVVAFGRRAADGSDELVLVAETKPNHDEAAVAREVRLAVRNAIGLRVDAVEIVERNTIPKTSSGKLQRAAARRMLETGIWRDNGKDGALLTVGRLLESQLAHLRHRLFDRGT